MLTSSCKTFSYEFPGLSRAYPDHSQGIWAQSRRWRIDGDWWRVPISRMYWVVITPTMLLEIFEDLCTGDWYLQRVID